MTTETGPAQVETPLDAAGRVAESLACRGCGYDLKGIAADGGCPECGSAVERSIRGDLLQFCDPGWLDRLATGLLVIFIGVIGGIVVQLGIMLAAGLAAAMAAAAGATRATTIVAVAGGLLAAIVTLVSVIGMWMVTTLDPGRTETESKFSARKLARIAILASLVATPMEMTVAESGMLSGGGGMGALELLIIIVTLTTATIAVAGWVAFYVYLRQLALRATFTGLARQIRIIMWGFAISMVFSLAFAATTMLLLATGRMAMTGAVRAAALTVGVGSCLGVLGYVSFEIWAGVVFMVLRRRLKAIVAEGRPR